MRSNWSDAEIESALSATLRPVVAPVGAVERMLASLPARVPAIPWWRRRAVRLGVAMAAAVLLIVLGASPQARDAVANTVRDLFYFIPGQGIRRTEPGNLVLAHPATVTRDGITLRVISVLSNASAVTVSYQVTGLPGGKDASSGLPASPGAAYLEEINRGIRYDLRGERSAEGGSAVSNTVTGEMVFLPLRPGVRDVTLHLPSEALRIPMPAAARLGAWRVVLHLVTPAQAQLTPAGPGTSAVTLHGITVRLDHVQHAADGVVAHVSASGNRAIRVQSIFLAPPLSGDNFVSWAGGSDGWDLRLPSSTRTLRIDEVDALEAGDAAVGIDIPATGSVTLNLEVALGRYSVVLEKGAWVDDGPNGHVFRIDYHVGPTIDGGRLGSWRIDGNIGQESDRASGRGSLKLMTPPGQSPPVGHVTMLFTDPVIVIEGPWVMAVN